MKIEEILSRVLEVPNSAFFYTPPIYKRSSSYFFIKPEKSILISTKDDLKKMHLIEGYLNKNMTAYSLIKYEAGYLFEEKLTKYIDKTQKDLIQFYFFDEKNVKKIRSEKIEIGDVKKNYAIENFKLNKSKSQFYKDIKSIKTFIEKGDTYQVNYTVKGNFEFAGNPINLFKNLIFNQSAEYSAFINNGDDLIISLSPELFFCRKKDKIYSKPMKGTAKRGINISDDLLARYSLSVSKKDKAENLMIVDLLRNDIGKISTIGKVKTKNLFSVETYETLHQMVSTIEGKLDSKTNMAKIISSLFPCGSITGAPKIRTMQIIHEIEAEKRGIYTGAIGILSKEKSVFNVAIRTIKLNKKTGNGRAGLGSGIVWDSKPDKEYKETLLKGNFISKPLPYFGLFETMRLENGQIFLLEDHLKRLKNACSYFLFNFDKVRIMGKLSETISTAKSNSLYRVKLILSKWNGIKVESKEFNEHQNDVKIILSDKKISTENKFQYFKTTNRNLYDKEHLRWRKDGFFDVIFFNENNETAEGAITNLFLMKDGIWYTSPIESGILNGVYRNYMIKNEGLNIREEKIYLNDLLNCDQIILTNSLREQIKVKKLYLDQNEFKEFE